MRTLLAAAGLWALASSAFADTLQEVTKHGVVLTLQGAEIPLSFTPDGKVMIDGGQVIGAWRIDGEKLCTTTDPNPAEMCVAYPADKKSGDMFDLETPGGPVKIRIR